SAMKLLSRLFRAAPSPPATSTVESVVAPEPAAPTVDPGAQQRLLSAIDAGSVEPVELMRLAVEGQTTRLRQAAAAAIDDPASWQALLPRLRGRDKVAYKLIKGRLDALLEAQRNQAQARGDAEALCVLIEKHAAKPHDALFAAALTLYSVRWQALPPGIDSAILQRGQQALDRCQQVIAAHEREVARLAAEREAEEIQARALQAELLAQQQAADEQAAAEQREQAAVEEAREIQAQAEAEAR